MRNAKGLQTKSGTNYLASVPKGEEIVDMVVHQEQLFIATNKHIYILTDDKRLEMLEEES